MLFCNHMKEVNEILKLYGKEYWIKPELADLITKMEK